MNWDSRLAFGRTICLLVSFKILFNLDAQIWQWHELQLGASGRRGRSQVKLFQSNPLALVKPCVSNTHQRNVCHLFILRLCVILLSWERASVCRLRCDKTVKEIFWVCVYVFFLSGSQKACNQQFKWTLWHSEYNSFNPVKSLRNLVPSTVIAARVSAPLQFKWKVCCTLSANRRNSLWEHK